MKLINFDLPVDIIKSQEEEGKWIVEGFASTGDIDLAGDLITEEAFKDAEDDLKKNSTLLDNHDPDKRIGHILDVKAKKHGLWIKALISKTAEDVWQQIKEGVLNKFSIRGKVIDIIKEYSKEFKRWIKKIKKMYLIEASLVSLPMNPEAEVTRWYVQKGQSETWMKAVEDFEKSGGKILEEDIALDGSRGNPVLTKTEKKEVKIEMTFEKKKVEDINKELDSEIASLESLIEKSEDGEVKESLNALLEKAKGKKAKYPYSEPEERKKAKKDISKLPIEDLEVELARKKQEKYPYPCDEKKDVDEEASIGELEIELAKKVKEKGVGEAKKAGETTEDKDKHLYPGTEQPDKKAGDAYTQDDVDQIIVTVKAKVEDYFNDMLTKKDKESMSVKNDLGKRLDAIKAELNSTKADAQVEKKWSSLVGSAYKEEDEEVIKPILKKAILGEVVSPEETDLLIDKKIGESSLLVDTEEVEKAATELKREEIIKMVGIKTKVKD